MARTDRTRLLVFLVTLAAVVGLVAVAFLAVAPRDGITVTTQGSPVVGSDLRFLVTVRQRHPTRSSGTYLSLGGLNGSFEVTAGQAQGHPWDRPNVWNLTGLDLAYGLTFSLDVIPTWAAEIPLQASLWSAPQGTGAVRFLNGDTVDLSTVSVELASQPRVTTIWPLTASAVPDSALVVGQPATIRITVHGAAGHPSISGPLFLSVATKPMYYTVDGVGSSDNPWNVTALWNITGADWTQGIETALSATPGMAAKGVGLEVMVWSPRAGLDAVKLDSDGTILTGGAVRLWMDITFSYSVASA